MGDYRSNTNYLSCKVIDYRSNRNNASCKVGDYRSTSSASPTVGDYWGPDSVSRKAVGRRTMSSVDRGVGGYPRTSRASRRANDYRNANSVSRRAGNLSSGKGGDALMLARNAESLYWIGRYVERADDTARILDVAVHQLLEDATVDPDRTSRVLLRVLGIEPPDGTLDVWSVTDLVAFSHDGGSIIDSIANARENARGQGKSPPVRCGNV